MCGDRVSGERERGEAKEKIVESQKKYEKGISCLCRRRCRCRHSNEPRKIKTNDLFRFSLFPQFSLFLPAMSLAVRRIPHQYMKMVYGNFVWIFFPPSFPFGHSIFENGRESRRKPNTHTHTHTLRIAHTVSPNEWTSERTKVVLNNSRWAIDS